MILPSKKALLLSGVAVGGGTLAIMTAGVAAPAVGMLVGIVAGSAGLSVFKRCSVAKGCGCGDGETCTSTDGVECSADSGFTTGAHVHERGDSDAASSLFGTSSFAESDDAVLLQVMAAKLRDEISELKQNLNDSKNSRFFERGELLQELAEKESKLKNIGETLGAASSRSDG